MAESRTLPTIESVGQHRATVAGEPLVFHCNHYNYWLQHTLRLDPSLGMDAVIRDAAEACARAFVAGAKPALGLETPEAVLAVGADLFAQLGFGRLDLSAVTDGVGVVTTPTSHYGQTLAVACKGELTRDQNLFDQGYAAGLVGAAFGSPPGSLRVVDNACMSTGATLGRFELVRGPAREFRPSPGLGPVSAAPAPGPLLPSNIDEAAILGALSGLDLGGNEEGLIPRFGVILTRHFANFYNLISHGFVSKMEELGLRDVAESLLIEAGQRCAFNTFGGIMVSAEWDAVVRPQCQTRDDWVHGMVAVVNAFGWGCWRVAELEPRKLVMRIWDDYESTGWLGMAGRADRPIAYLAAGGVAGLMGLVTEGAIMTGPTLDESLYARACQGPGRYAASQTHSAARGDAYTQVVAEPAE